MSKNEKEQNLMPYFMLDLTLVLWLKGYYIAPNTKGVIVGLGLKGYELALQAFL
ncbi:MAG: hypothetical protein L3J20_12220 [Flavobacteriaceae bacterium]|nr:hypothetical protein [Flavobacteriaceae bacterium]